MTMPNQYATVYNVRLALGDEMLMRLLDRPTLEAVDADPISGTPAIPAIEDDPVLLQKIDWANAQVDAYLRAVLPLPLPGDPNLPGFFPDLVEHAANLVRWGLVGRRPDVQSQDDRDRYNDAIRYLRDISEGVSSIDITVMDGDHPTGAAVVRVGFSPEPVQIVDPVDPLRYY